MKNVALLHNPVLEYRPDSSVPANITAVAHRIAGILEGDLIDEDKATQGTYRVPFAAVHKPLALRHGITGSGDVYGGIVLEPNHADKAILHELPDWDSEHPSWYSQNFTKSIGEATLPGFTAFTPHDAAEAFKKMRDEGLSFRFKDPSSTGGLGQQLVRNQNELAEALTAHESKFANVGAVLEVDLENVETVAVGYVDLDGKTYTWYGKPHDVEFNDMLRFGGNELTVVKGGFDVLRRQCKDPSDLLAVVQTEHVFDAYSNLGTIITRGTFDVVRGNALDGTYMSGVADPSFRPSASSAAEIRAIEAFAESAGTHVVTTRLVYDYDKKFVPDESSHELFLAHKNMNIYVELVDKQ